MSVAFVLQAGSIGAVWVKSHVWSETGVTTVGFPELAGSEIAILVEAIFADALAHEFKLGAQARVAELVDALDLGSSAARRGGSSPPFRTTGLICPSPII